MASAGEDGGAARESAPGSGYVSVRMKQEFNRSIHITVETSSRVFGCDSAKGLTTLGISAISSIPTSLLTYLCQLTTKPKTYIPLGLNRRYHNPT